LTIPTYYIRRVSSSVADIEVVAAVDTVVVSVAADTELSVAVEPAVAASVDTVEPWVAAVAYIAGELVAAHIAGAVVDKVVAGAALAVPAVALAGAHIGAAVVPVGSCIELSVDRP
jgi:hypothetical protein